jgi:cell division topological specificity factor
MSFKKYLRIRRKSASIAKDRLHIIISQERTEKDSLDFLPLLRKDILAAIQKYAHINIDEVKVDLLCKDNNSILELNVVLPDSKLLKKRDEVAEKIQ